MEVEVGYNVYLPDGYAQSEARYPVIYFLHGAGGNENSDARGFSALIARMVHEGKIPPVICVFPNGGTSGYQDHPGEKVMVETLIVKELLPLIDRRYRTRANRENRTIGGFSMGGGGAVRLSLKHPDLFSAAGAWAGAYTPHNEPIPAELEPVHLRRVAGRVRLLLIVGDQDPTYAGYQAAVRNLEAAQYLARCQVLKGVPHDLALYYQQTGEEMVRFLTDAFRRPE